MTCFADESSGTKSKSSEIQRLEEILKEKEREISRMHESAQLEDLKKRIEKLNAKQLTKTMAYETESSRLKEKLKKTEERQRLIKCKCTIPEKHMIG